MTTSPPLQNNFDLLRLFAAIQVLLLHAYTHFELKGQSLIFDFLVDYFLSYFPGVPIFFFISGFLIFWSYSRNANNPRKYFLNRVHRIYPALWVSFLVTVVVLIIFNQITINTFFSTWFWVWVISQITIFPVWTPTNFRDFGLGNPNGALWTICTELQFYVTVPFLYKISKSSKLVLALIAVLSYVANQVFSLMLNQESTIYKLLFVSIIPYLFYFLMGIFSFLFFEKIYPLFKDKFVFWLVGYSIYCMVFSKIFNLYTESYTPNLLGLIGYFILAGLILSFSFNFTSLSHLLLKKTDISYGTYLYHGLFLNIFVLNKPKNLFDLLVFTIISCFFGLISWFLVEKRFLKK